MEPNRSNDYQLPSWPPTALTRDLWNAVFLDIALRLTARENLEANFEDLIAQGIQSSLDYIQVNVGPQLAALQEAIDNAEDRIEEIIVDGTAPNSAKLGGRLPAYFATAQALLDGLALKADDADFEARTRAVVAELTGNAPAALDTIYELAAAIGNDPNIRQTLLNAIALKFDKAGGTITGNLSINKANPTLQLFSAGVQSYNLDIGADGTFRIVQAGNGSELFRISPGTGSVWTKEFGDLNGRINTQANAARDAAIAASAGFTSGQLTPTLGGLVQAAHGLGVRPKFYQAFLVCTVTQGNWVVGDEISVNADSRGSTNEGHGVEVYVDETNIYGRCGLNSLGLKFNKATGALQSAAPANWNVVLRARA